MAQRPPLTLKARALALVAQREHSPLELRRKLLAQMERQRASAQRRALTREPGLAGASSDAATQNGAAADAEAGHGDEGLVCVQQQLDELLAWLLAEGLLSTERFVESRVHVRAPRQGKRRIVQELARHGMTLDAETAAALERSETARAQAVWLKRFGKIALDPAGRAKQMRFLCARGFGADVAHRIVTGRD